MLYSLSVHTSAWLAKYIFVDGADVVYGHSWLTITTWCSWSYLSITVYFD